MTTVSILPKADKNYGGNTRPLLRDTSYVIIVFFLLTLVVVSIVLVIEKSSSITSSLGSEILTT